MGKSGRAASAGAAGVLIALAAPAWADIYKCTDAQGRRYTSDRPIEACATLTQYQLNPSGTVRRAVPPAQTLGEQIALQSQAAETRSREEAQRQLDRALLRRYPSSSEFEQQRTLALENAPPAQRATVAARFDSDLLRLREMWQQ